MTDDATGRGTEDTGHPMPSLRAPSPDMSTRVGVPPTYALPEGTTGRGTLAAPRDTPPTAPFAPRDTAPFAPRDTGRDAPRDAAEHGTPRGTPHGTPDGTGNGTPRGTSRALSLRFVPGLVASYRGARDTRRARKRDTVAAHQASRDATAREIDGTRNALARDNAKGRRRADTDTRSEADRLAPIPTGLVKIGIWLDRAVGSIVPTASLVVSATATIQVGQDEPLKMGWLAVAFTLGLEGSVWYLNRLREAFKLEGDSTFSLNVAIGLIIALIFGLIGGHAIWNNAGRQALNITVPGTEVEVPLSEVVPAIAIAVMSAIGAYVWAKKALFKHRAKLRADGQIDPRAPKFAFGRWIFAPRETLGALRYSYRFGVKEAQLAVKDWRTWKAAGRPAIWPVPTGFHYVNGKLTEMTIEELRDAAERDALLDALTERDARDAGQRDDRPATTGHRDAGRPAQSNGTRDGRNGTLFAPGNGTPNGTVAGQYAPTHGTPRTGQHGTGDTPPARDADGTRPETNGTHQAAGAGHGTPGGEGHGTGDTTGDLADILRYTEHLLAVVEAYPDWQTGELPGDRAITRAIHAARQKRDGGSYKSNSTSAKVRAALGRLREHPELLDVMRVEQDGAA